MRNKAGIYFNGGTYFQNLTISLLGII